MTFIRRFTPIDTDSEAQSLFKSFVLESVFIGVNLRKPFRKLD